MNLDTLRESDWYYDDARHVGVDFADQKQVATYDARQKSTDDAASALLDELGLKPNHSFVDFGCGTGVLVCQAALRAKEAHAVDISEGMLQVAQQRAQHLGAIGLRCQKAGFLSFDLPAESIDIATTQYALHHLNDFWKLIALQRIYTCLKPGGVFLLRDVVFSCHPSELANTVDAWLRWMQEERGYTRAENVAHVREEHSTFAWVMEGLIERAGFRLMNSRFSRGVYATYIVQRPQ